MKAIVVYESLWGNTAAIARAIAEGIGEDAVALPTKEADPATVAGVDLVVAGGPVFAFHLSSERTREQIREHPEPDAPPADLSGPSIREWLESVPVGQVAFAAFDTEVRGPFGKGAPTIARELVEKGYRPIAKPEGFIVAGKYGPLKEGEVERARRWGASLREALV